MLTIDSWRVQRIFWGVVESLVQRHSSSATNTISCWAGSQPTSKAFEGPDQCKRMDKLNPSNLICPLNSTESFAFSRARRANANSCFLFFFARNVVKAERRWRSLHTKQRTRVTFFHVLTFHFVFPLFSIVSHSTLIQTICLSILVGEIC